MNLSNKHFYVKFEVNRYLHVHMKISINIHCSFLIYLLRLEIFPFRKYIRLIVWYSKISFFITFLKINIHWRRLERGLKKCKTLFSLFLDPKVNLSQNHSDVYFTHIFPEIMEKEVLFLWLHISWICNCRLPRASFARSREEYTEKKMLLSQKHFFPKACILLIHKNMLLIL